MVSLFGSLTGACLAFFWAVINVDNKIKIMMGKKLRSIKLVYSIVLSLVFSISAMTLSAQGKPAKLPMENKPAFEKFLKEIYDAFEKKDYKALKNYFDGRAGEISPDGTLTMGIKNLD